MKEENNNRKSLMYYYGVVLVIILAFNLIIMPFIENRQVHEVDYGTFTEMVSEDVVEQVQISETENQIFFTTDEQIYRVGMVEDVMLTERLLQADVEFSGEIREQMSPLLSFLLTWILPIGIFMLIGNYMQKRLMKAGGGNSMNFNMGKTNAKIYDQSTEGITFADVRGQDEAKESLEEVVDFLHEPDKYTQVGAKMPTGVLLVGPPGTGKTMLAKAVAGEAEVPFFSISGSEFVEMFAGAGAARVRDLFKQAKEKAPCIIFIDEIDAIGKKRSGKTIGNDEREQTLNQLLTEMNGFEDNPGVLILAATNQPESLDPALLRPGRFDRQVQVELPDLIGREEILKVHANKVKHSVVVDFNKIARMASGASGADLANIVNEAALRAVRMGRQEATQEDFQEAVEIVIAGAEKKNAILSEDEKRIVSYHEVGHALVAALQSHSAPVEKITIIPRTSGALGYTLQVPEDNNNLLSREELLDKLAVYAGGRAAEEITFGSITTGASNDIEQMTKIARSMITQYGMDDEFGMVQMESRNAQYLGEETSSSVSPETRTRIDQAVVELINEQYSKAKELLLENQSHLVAISEYLFTEETITGREFMQILNERGVFDEEDLNE